MKRVACIIAAACLGLALAGCGGAAPDAGKTNEQPAEKQQEAVEQGAEQKDAAASDSDAKDAVGDTSKGDSGSSGTGATSDVPDSGKKWDYAYPGDESPYLGAVCAYLAKRDAELFDLSDGMIPALEIVRVDDSDPNDIKLFGVYEIRNYSLQNKTLQLQSGATEVGVIRIAPDGEGYKPLGAKFAEDGAAYDTSLKKICEGYKGLYDDLNETVVPDKVRKLYMEECIEAFDLDVEKYQDIGEDPMPIDEWLSYSFD